MSRPPHPTFRRLADVAIVATALACGFYDAVAKDADLAAVVLSVALLVTGEVFYRDLLEVIRYRVIKRKVRTWTREWMAHDPSDFDPAVQKWLREQNRQRRSR